jgi:antitoxin PrlF
MARRAQARTNGRTAQQPVLNKFGNSKALRTTLDAGGRVVIPVEFRKALGVGPGDQVLIRFLDGEVRIYTLDHAIRRLQEWGAGLAPPERVLSEELIAERRDEAARV